MNTLTEPIKFYLRNREQIEEWANLRDEAAAAADAFFRGLAPTLESLRLTLPGNPLLYTEFTGDYPKIFFYRMTWRGTGPCPRVAIGVEWNRSSQLDEAYYGVWVGRDQRGGVELEDSLNRALTSEGWDSERYWPLKRNGKSTRPDFWQDLHAFHRELVAMIQECWSAYFAKVDAALGRRGRGARTQTALPSSRT